MKALLRKSLNVQESEFDKIMLSTYLEDVKQVQSMFGIHSRIPKIKQKSNFDLILFR